MRHRWLFVHTTTMNMKVADINQIRVVPIPMLRTVSMENVDKLWCVVL